MSFTRFRFCFVPFLLLFAIFYCTSIWADVRLAEIFGSGMVLQREMPVTVWGWAEPGEKIGVTIAGQEKSTEADAEGRWSVKLEPLNIGDPISLIVKGKNELKLDDILVGDVWLCSGQSNMEWKMHAFPDSRTEISSIENPNIRYFAVGKAWTQTPQDHFKGSWVPCNPQTVGSFSATSYYFGAKLNSDLKVPIGLINSSWGGTKIEPWTAPEGFHDVPALSSISNEIIAKDPTSKLHKELAEKTKTEYEKWLTVFETNLTSSKPLDPPPVYPKELAPYQNNQQPTVLYNGMIHPMIPMTIKGIIWYQGESNRGDGALYTEKMKALIQGWRKVFENEDLGFYFVQIAPFNYGNNPEALALLWEAQAKVEKEVPKTGMAVINDVGNLKDIHPAGKKTVGERLALLALNRTYGKTEVVCASPEPVKMQIEGDTIFLDFVNAGELKTRDGKSPTWFELAGGDGVFHQAETTVQGTSLRVKSPEVSKPFLVRFAWSMLAEPNLVNEAGLPLGAFRLGEIPETDVLGKFVGNEAKNFKLLYSFNPLSPVMTDNEKRLVYTTDRSKELTGKVKRVGYFLHLKPKNKDEQYVFATMPPLDQDLVKLGVPTKISGAQFQKKVSDVSIFSNVSGVETGTFAEGCNVEFWDCNYAAPNATDIPGASATAFDFGDQMTEGASPGYGSMQLHHFTKKQTVFAFNNFRAGTNAEIGIGNCPRGTNPDWTFTRSANDYEAGQFLILVEFE